MSERPTPRQEMNVRSIMQPRRALPTTIEKARDPGHAFRRLVAYLWPFRPVLLVVCGLIVVYSGLGLAGPWLLGRAIDRYISEGLTQGLARIALTMLAVYLLYNLFQVVAGWLMARVSQLVLKAVRRDLFARLQDLSLSYFDRHGGGDLMSRLTNDVDAINQAVAQNVVALLASVLSLVGIVVAMFVLDVWLALASLTILPVMIWFGRFVARYTRKGFRQLQNRLGALNGVSEEAISGLKVVKAFGRNDAVVDSFRSHNEQVYRAGVYASTYALLLMPLTNVLGNLFIIVMAGVGGWLALHDLVSVGVIATFITYGRDFVQPLRQLANMYNSIQAALAGAERVFEVIDAPEEVEDAPDACSLPVVEGQVRFDHVHFAYEPESPVIHDMSMEARPGQMVALVGHTGAGKTTFINLLSRFYEIDGGVITIDGIDIRKIRKAELRRRLGIVLQDTFLFADTVLENIRYGRLDATDEECVQAAVLADADPFIRQLPQGYATDLSERAGNLSQGQRQLLAISRAILADPAILILDEATSSVDTRTEAHIQKALLRLMKSRTSFVIAHRISTIRDADQVLVIDHGRIVETGTHQELLALKGTYHRLYYSQFKGQAI